MNRFLLLFFIVFSMIPPVQAQTYKQLWQRVEEMEKKNLPRSVIEDAKIIYDKAQYEKNIPQMMRAYLTMMVYRGEISPDSIEPDIKGLELWADNPQMSVPDRAVLHSVLGELLITKDFDKGYEFLLLSLKDSIELVHYPADKLVPMTKGGETSRLYFDNNLYDLLARRAIGLWRDYSWRYDKELILKQIADTYQSLLEFYQQEGKRSAWLLTALDAYPDADEELLHRWIKEYGDLEVCAEVYLRLSQRMVGEEKPAERLACVREAIRRFPHYTRIQALKNVEKEILSSGLSMTVFSAYPEQPIRMQVNYRNLSGLVAEVYQLDLSPDSKTLQDVHEKTVRKYGTKIREEFVELLPTTDYRMTETEVALRPLPQGVYYLSVNGKGHRDIKEGVVMVVAPTMEIYRPLPGNQRETFVVDKLSGTPQREAVITVEERPWQRYRYAENNQKQTHVNLFTDRAIYRPGQTVQYSGLVYEQQGDSVHTIVGKNMSVMLLDTDGKEIGSMTIETDEFGSFSGSFALPEGGQTGIYRLKTENRVLNIRVEEYKRPTFEVIFDEVKEEYKTGDSLEVTGTAITYAGAPVANASVQYTVERMERSWWRNRGPVTNRVEGHTRTDADGHFVVPVHFLPTDGESWTSYTYVVQAEITAQAGETRSGSLDLPLGSSSLMVNVQPWKETLVKEHPESLTFAVRNLMRQPVETEVTCEVMKGDQSVCHFIVKSNISLIPEELYNLPSGRYRLKVSVKDEAGKMNQMEYPFTLFAMNDTRLPYEAIQWGYQTSDTFPATILYGSCEKDVTLFYDVFSGNKHLESKQIAISDSLLRIPFEYKEAYGDAVLVSFAFVKNSQLYTQSYTIRKAQPDKSLQLKWTTFRDKLQPGNQETWTLKVIHPDGQPARAQLLASMYDASLDAFIPHTWNLNVMFSRPVPYTFWRAEGNENHWLNLYYPLKTLSVKPLAYSVLDIPFVAYRVRGGMKMYSTRAMVKNTVNLLESQADVVFEEEIVPIAERDETSVFVSSPDEMNLRSNFAETAFFYPHLRTDDNGEVNISFTLPESLTTWKFMGLAHTSHMDYGQISAEAVASMEFMLQPNMPRFVRVGDEVSLSASLINLSDKDVIGNVRMELFNPKNNQLYLKKKQRFIVTPNATTTVHFGFEVSEKYEDLAVRWIAEGDNFSDGEQRPLPVLSNKQWITESVPLYINGEGLKVFSLETLFNHHSKSISHPKMTVEFTGNPGWYAVEALQVLSNPESEDALSWATSYYANALTEHLAKTHSILSSRLEGDTLAIRMNQAIRKLQDLQNEEGSWSWFKGMKGNRFMTTQITELLTRLQVMTGELTVDDKMQKMYTRALTYLAKEAKEEYMNMMKEEKNSRTNIYPSEQVLHYLYICAINGNQGADLKVNDYFIDKLAQLETLGLLTIYGKAQGAVILQMVGKKKKAKEFLQSVMEYSVYTDEMGRYFDTPRASYSWHSYKIPTQVAVMEAVHSIANEMKTVEELKRWLLQQKRVQDWDTPIATADAVYALLNIGENVLTNTGECELVLGKTDIRLTKNDTLSYVKQTIDGKVTDIREVTVEKFSPGMGWGAVYAEYEEEMNQIGMQGDVLRIRKEIYKNGKQIENGELLRVGDKLTIRLIVEADRDMDFIEVKDERAACMEPVDVISGYRWTEGLGTYQRTKDTSTSFFIDQMRKGTYVLQYDVHVNIAGTYQCGASTIRSVYAPEYNGHEGGGKINVE